jgi:hypothetical protein
MRINNLPNSQPTTELLDRRGPVEMEERTGAEIFRFENAGDSLTGTLLAMEDVEIGGKPTVSFIFQDEDSARTVSFLGTVDLNTKIRASDIGKRIQIRYGGKDPQTEAGKNAIKRFKVYVQKDK